VYETDLFTHESECGTQTSIFYIRKRHAEISDRHPRLYGRMQESNVLVYGWDAPHGVRQYVVQGSEESRICISAAKDEIFVGLSTSTQSKSIPISRYEGSNSIQHSIIKPLSNMLNAACASGNAIGKVSCGTSIAVASLRKDHSILIADTHEDSSETTNDRFNDPTCTVFTHLLTNPMRGVVSKISCGASHCLILSEYTCLSYGTGKHGELGTGSRTTYANTLQTVHLAGEELVSEIAAGHNYSALVTALTGDVYTFGNGAYYKLGHGDDEDRLVPTRVVELEVGAFRMDGTTSGVQHIACGTWHTVVVAKGTNDVYGWGWNKFGNLGANPTSHNSTGSRAGVGAGGADGRVQHKEEIVSLPRRIEDLDDAHLLGDCCDTSQGMHIMILNYYIGYWRFK